jgi:hypothetical protein
MRLRTNEEEGDKEKNGSCGFWEDFGPGVRRLAGLGRFPSFIRFLLIFFQPATRFQGNRKKGRGKRFMRVPKHVSNILKK